MSLSLCMIVRDEAETLAQGLASARSLVDEMIVVDTGSTDQTVAIAQAQGAKVYSFPWIDDFAAARNYSLQQASGDWVLVLDADETLVPEVIPLIQGAIATEYDQAIVDRPTLVFNLLRLEVGAAQAPYSLLSRLFRRHPQVQFSRPYHELIDDSVEALLQREPQWRIVNLPQVAILHQGYQAGAIAAKNKFQRAQTLLESYVTSQPTDAYACSKLGALYIQIGQLAQGVALLQRTLQAQPGEPAILYELHYHLGLAYSQLGELGQASHHYQQAIAQPIFSPLKLGAYHNWGTLLQDQGKLIEARQVFQQLLTLDPNLPLAYFDLGLVHKDLGDFVGAITYYQQAIQRQPDYAAAHQNLGVVLLKIGQVPESQAAFRRAIALYEQQQSEEAERLRQGLQALGISV